MFTGNPGEDALLREGAKASFELARSIIEGSALKLWNENEVRRAMATYHDRYLDRHGNIKVLTMPKPLRLVDMHTAVQFVSPDYLNMFASTESLRELFRERGTRRLPVMEGERRDGIAVADTTQYLNVLGAPGAGKSTFLRRLGLEALLPRRTWLTKLTHLFKDTTTFSSITHNCLPVLIELRRLRGRTITALVREEFQNCGFPEYERFVDAALEHGRLLILMDGLDEVPRAELDFSITQIRDFVDKYGQNRFVSSCRTAFYKSYFARFTDVVLADFDDEQIKSFIRRWFASTDHDASIESDAIWRQLREQQATLELVRTPLLLTFVCITYDANQKLPANRSNLYKSAFEILLQRWAAEKRVHNERIADLSPELEIELLTEIAGTAFREDRIFFTEQDLYEAIARFMTTQVNAPKTISSQEILDAIEVQQGLLVRRTADALSFSHLTMQEYLAARYFGTRDRLPELLRHAFDVRWREVFLLLFGLGRSDDLTLELARQVASFAYGHPWLRHLVDWASHSVDEPNTPSHTAAAKRLAVVGIVLAWSQPLASRIAIEGEGSIAGILQALDSVIQRLDTAVHADTQPAYAFREHTGESLYRTVLAPHAVRRLFQRDVTHIKDQVEQRVVALRIVGTRERDLFDFTDIRAALWQALHVPEVWHRLTPDNLRDVHAYVSGLELLLDGRDAALSLAGTTWQKACDFIVTSRARAT